MNSLSNETKRMLLVTDKKQNNWPTRVTIVWKKIAVLAVIFQNVSDVKIYHVTDENYNVISWNY